MTYVTVPSFVLFMDFLFNMSGFQVALMAGEVALPWSALFPEQMAFILICVVLYS